MLSVQTFLITAILSMRCAKSSNSTKAQAGQKKLGSRWHVFAGGFLALALMTVMAAAGGQLLPLLLRQELRTIFMICLLVIFGAKMLHEAAVYNETAEEAGKQVPTSSCPPHASPDYTFSFPSLFFLIRWLCSGCGISERKSGWRAYCASALFLAPVPVSVERRWQFPEFCGAFEFLATEELKDLCESEESVNGSKLLRLARTFFSPVFLQVQSAIHCNRHLRRS